MAKAEEEKDKIDILVEKYPHIWKTRAAVLSWLRGGIRRSLWNRSPQKLEFIKKNRIRIPNPNPKGKVKEIWGGVCGLTGEVLPLSELDVDHKAGNNSLLSLEDVRPFIEAIALVTEDELMLVGKDAHKVKSHSERKGISFEEALVEKRVIAMEKDKSLVPFLLENGYNSDDSIGKNAKQRRQQAIEILMSQGEEDV